MYISPGLSISPMLIFGILRYVSWFMAFKNPFWLLLRLSVSTSERSFISYFIHYYNQKHLLLQVHHLGTARLQLWAIHAQSLSLHNQPNQSTTQDTPGRNEKLQLDLKSPFAYLFFNSKDEVRYRIFWRVPSYLEMYKNYLLNVPLFFYITHLSHKLLYAM